MAALAGWTLVFRVLLCLTALALVTFVVLDWIWPLWNGSQLPRDLLALCLGVLLAPALVLVWNRDLDRRVNA